MRAKSSKNLRMARKIRATLLAFDDSKAAVGKRFVQVRRGFGLNQKQMAEELGITAGALNKIERGVNRPSNITALAVWIKFHTPMPWLLTGFVGDLPADMRRRLTQGPPQSEGGQSS